MYLSVLGSTIYGMGPYTIRYIHIHDGVWEGGHSAASYAVVDGVAAHAAMPFAASISSTP